MRGPCRSTRMATASPRWSAIRRTAFIHWPRTSGVPCEALMRTTLTPASRSWPINSSDCVAGPRVATILVRRITVPPGREDIPLEAGRPRRSASPSTPAIPSPLPPPSAPPELTGRPPHLPPHPPAPVATRRPDRPPPPARAFHPLHPAPLPPRAPPCRHGVPRRTTAAPSHATRRPDDHPG